MIDSHYLKVDARFIGTQRDHDWTKSSSVWELDVGILGHRWIARLLILTLFDIRCKWSEFSLIYWHRFSKIE